MNNFNADTRFIKFTFYEVGHKTLKALNSIKM